MKLGIKIFCGIMIPFSIILLFGGFRLLSYFIDTTMNQEIQAAGEQYQYNKFMIQSEMITKGKVLSDIEMEELSGAAALYSDKYDPIYNDLCYPFDVTGMLKEIRDDSVHYQFHKADSHVFLVIYGVIEYNNESNYLLTEVDVTNMIEIHEEMRNRFLFIYLFSVITSILISVGLSILFTHPIKSLSVATEQIANGNYGEIIKIRRNDEVGGLALNFNRMSIAIKEKVDELSENARQKEDFAANFAHELKTPLTSIIGYADRIYQKDLSREEQKAAAWYIWDEGMHLESLSKKLMDMTFLNHHDFMLEEMRADILFDDLIRDISYFCFNNHIEVVGYMQSAYIRVEYDLFKTLFYNLIDNAVKAKARNVKINGKIQREAKLYEVVFEDDGEGIPPDEVERIKEAFYMVHKSRSRKMHGAGLGLALSEKIVEIHGSKLSFYSDGLHGTKVSFFLECVEESENE